MKKKISTFRKLLIMLVAILLFFGGYNLTWYLLKYHPYQQLCTNMQLNDDSERKRYYANDKNYLYTVKMPSYLGFEGGFLSITPNEGQNLVVEEDGQITMSTEAYVSMFIWPQIFRETKYAVMISEGTSFSQLYIDKNLNYIPFDNESIIEIKKNEQMINEHYEQIKEMLEGAQVMWGEKI